MLNYPWLPDYPGFQEVGKIFKEKGMQTFADLLHYYNDLDVAPGLEALEKMRAFYTDKDIDVLKDAVSFRRELALSLESDDGARS